MGRALPPSAYRPNDHGSWKPHYLGGTEIVPGPHASEDVSRTQPIRDLSKVPLNISGFKFGPPAPVLPLPHSVDRVHKRGLEAGALGPALEVQGREYSLLTGKLLKRCLNDKGQGYKQLKWKPPPSLKAA